jgi:hypothetical protein
LFSLVLVAQQPAVSQLNAALPAHESASIAGASCGKWTVVKSPDGRSRHNGLNSVSASAANNIWAVGGYNSGGGSRWEPLLLMHVTL